VTSETIEERVLEIDVFIARPLRPARFDRRSQQVTRLARLRAFARHTIAKEIEGELAVVRWKHGELDERLTAGEAEEDDVLIGTGVPRRREHDRMRIDRGRAACRKGSRVPAHCE